MMLSSFIPHPSSFILFAEQGFPRGPGFYFSPIKLLVVIATYLWWVRVCWWVDDDALYLKLDRKKWNALMLGAGLAGLLIVWVLPSFEIAIAIQVMLLLAALLAYASVRNNEVPEHEKLFTAHYFRNMVQNWMHGKRRERADVIRKPEMEEEEQASPTLRFMSRSERGEETRTDVARAAGSPGYQAALELVQEALDHRATDIHLEPTPDMMTVRFRIDGILQATSPMTRTTGDAVLNIFKVLAKLDITEKRKPQDGAFSAVTGKREIDFRVATAGSVAGEKMVMRLLDRHGQAHELSKLGMRSALRDQIHSLVTQPHGLFIVCGPTGAGKSTTLYACLNEIDRYQQNVITVEDPVEYHIDNVTQIEVNLKAGKTFASELRSILRQDPDVIYIGEIRDRETAEIACQAAQTGHMVFTTLHANDTVTAIARLIDLDVPPFLIAGALTGVLAQRLIRVLCPKCKVKYKPNADLLRKANLPVDQIKHFCKPPEKPASDDDDPKRNGPVCEHCGGTGYRGRTGIFELLVINDKMREMIRENPNLTAVKQEAAKAGMKAMQEDGLRQVINGHTSVQELLRVVK